MKKLIFYLALSFGLSVFSQAPSSELNYVSPNGYFDNVFDHYGNIYNLSDLKIQPERMVGGVLERNTMLCSSGMFELYFETGSGMEDTSNATHNARRAVVCQVFQDLSDFINSPLKNPDNPTKVKIWVRNLNLYDPPSGVLGMASPFFNIPLNNNANFGGIVDNTIWRTVNSGIDAYINVGAPLTVANTVISAGAYYHGVIAFNFNSINWNTNLTVNSPAGQYDLYTVVLHEVVHSLGITSLINENGTSVFGSGFNYFSRYDKFLKNTTGTQFLINNGSSCSMYNYKFNTSLNTSILHPNSSNCVANQTNCSSAVKYFGSLTIPVYTPNCFDQGSSLSHFEDQCFSSNINDAYFVLSNVIPTGAIGTKRFLKPEERMVLCDIGYSVNTTYGNSSQLSFINYGGSICSGNSVVGINDGINSNNGAITFMGNSGTNILITGILNNDYATNLNDLRFECLMDVYDSSTVLSATLGNASTVITFNSITPGVHLLRYIPYNNSTGQRGNITYIYVYVMDLNNCAIPDACNLVMNGDFEQYSLLPSGPGQINRTCGWVAGNASKAEYFHVGSSNPSNSIPCNYFGLENDNIPLNMAYAGFTAANSESGWDSRQSMVNTLKTPLLPNTTYQLSFDVSLADSFNKYYMKPQFYLSSSLLITAGFDDIFIENPNMLFETTDYITTKNGWKKVYRTIQTGPVGGEKYLYIGALNNPDFIQEINPASVCGTYGWPLQAYGIHYFIDNVELIQLNGARLNIPEEHCQNAILSNLVSFVEFAPSNGVFSGPGIVLSGGVYTFYASSAGVGTHTIAYTYINSTGCPIVISVDVNVLDCTEEPEEPCPNVLVFTTPELATVDLHQAFGTITTHTNYIVSAGSDITFKGGKNITLNPNTVINYGSNFVAYLESCFGQRESNSKVVDSVEKSSRLNIYPNPTKGFVTISARDLKISKVMVTSLEGKIIYTKSNINNYSCDLTLEDFQIGIYPVIVETFDGEIIVDKIIKN